MSLSKRDIDDLRPTIDQLVSSFLGFSESSLVTASLNCISSGYDNDRTVGELCTILEETQAHRFSQQLFNVYDEYKAKGKSRKRKEEIPEYAYEMKKPKLTTDIPVMTTQPSPGQLTSDKIKEMMQDARKMIQQRKVELNIAAPAPAAPPPVLHSKSHLNDAMNKNKRAADLHSRIQEKLAAVAQKSTLVKPQSDEGLPMQQLQQSTNTTKPQPLILDEKGQTIDATTGEAIKLTHHTPTLKANIRAKRREEFKAVIEKPPEEVTDTAYFDPRVSFKSSHRGRRKFAFNERGKYEKLASRLRTKAQLEKLQADISKAAKKTGIASATKLASIHTSGDQKDDSLPEVEWWDSEVLQSESYFNAEGVFEKSQIEGITNLVEHPIQLRPPSESTKPVPLQVILTKKERRKLRRQNRGEAQKELQEKVRLGLLPPAEPKVRMANLMRVLGNEAIQDPTKVEAHVRAQMAKRQKAHEEANAARKLTKDQKRDKKAKKLQEDTSLGLHVAVYRVKDLNNPARKFKIEANANQLYMTGIVVCYKECNIVVVEGGPKQQKKFKRLMLHRIKWNDDSRPVKDEDSDSEEEEEQVNSCECVWEGQVKNRSFGELKIKVCPTERYAREHFIKHGVEHYWNFVYSDTILKTAGTDS